MNRDEMIGRLRERREPWDVLVVGGGATGAGVAVDAASRGYAVALVERHDFGKGTSSRSTKLIHGGVRYLRRGNIALVRNALRERARLRRNAPHLVHDLPFIVPCYRWWERAYYGLGLKLYDVLAGRHGFDPSRRLPRDATIERLPTLKPDGLRGGVTYHDGQFDDARLLINLVQTACEHGAAAANYVRVTALTKDAAGRVTGATAVDEETGEALTLGAKVVVNATGPFSDAVRRMDQPDAAAMIAPSQGAHVVLDRSFLPGDAALIVPRTPDGRVLFAIPWHGRTLVGTTDTPTNDTPAEPRPTREEIAFILETAGRYLLRRPTRSDVLSTFAGIRPLVKAGEAAKTSALSRDHVIAVSASGLVTIAGGKWTTYRRMAEDAVDRAAGIAGLPRKRCVTANLPIHGCVEGGDEDGALRRYGSDAAAVRALISSDPSWSQPLAPGLPFVLGEAAWATRHETARTVEDVLARRTRVLHLDARAAIRAAPGVASILADELGRDQAWQTEQVSAFTALARAYLPQ